MKKVNKISLWVAVLALSAASSQAQVVLGSFQGASDPNNAGWKDWDSGLAITASAPPADSQYAFVNAGVPGYTYSLQVTPSTGGYDQNLALNMTSAQMTAWQQNSYLTFTWSEPGPGTETGGYSQIAQVIFNTAGSATGVGFGSPVPFSLFQEEGSNGNDSGGMPVYDYWSSGSTALRTQEVTINYSTIKAADPSFATSYFQLIFVSEYGGGAPNYSYFNNVVLSTGPFGTEAATNVILGSFQGPSDTNNVGWTNQNTGVAIATDTEDSFVAAGVPGYAESLQIAGLPAGGNVGSTGQPNLILGCSPLQMAEFFTNAWLTFTFSVPSSAVSGSTAGYSQMYDLQFFCPGGPVAITTPWNDQTEGANAADQNGRPNFYYGTSSALQSQTVSVYYSNALSSIQGFPAFPSYLQLDFQGNFGGGAPDYQWLNNVILSLGPFGSSTPVSPPTLGIQVAKPALRMFSQGGGNRVELASQGNESWSGGAQYSFTIIGDNADTNYFETHIYLVPDAQIPTETYQAGSPYNNNYVEYQASNAVWLQIVSTNGLPTATANVLWKVNDPNANATQVALSIPNVPLVGTWNLAFSSASSGTLTPPGGPAQSFTIDSGGNPSSDFAGTVTAYFGVYAQNAASVGDYVDYSQISISGAPTSFVDNFTADASINASYWQINPTAASTSIVLVTAGDPLWVTWSPVDIGYGLGVSPGLPINEAPGYNYLQYGYNGNNSFVLPQQFNNYSDVPAGNAQGATMWELIPSDCLPSYQGVLDMGVTNAYFELISPPPAN